MHAIFRGAWLTAHWWCSSGWLAGRQVGNRLTKFPALAATCNLKSVDISRNSLKSLAGLANHRFVKNLMVDDNRLTSLEGLSHCRCLENLSACRNQLTGCAPAPISCPVGGCTVPFWYSCVRCRVADGMRLDAISNHVIVTIIIAQNRGAGVAG